MLLRPFRFLHAADLHLDQPAIGLSDAPEPLIDLLVDCTRQAAIRVFDAALDQRVDFVLLAGDVIDPKFASPRDWLLLVEQFERLAQRNIGVYWCGGPTDWLQQWPDFVSWPANVRIFPAGRLERYRYEIGGQAVCEIIGRGHDLSGPPRAYDFTPGDDDVFSVAVAHADWNCAALGEMGIDYWALGGQHQRTTSLESNCVAHYAGSPQGRCAAETGPHGCTLVAVDELRRIQLTPLPCDVLRWQTPRLSWTDLPNSSTSDRHQLERMLRDRTEQLLAEAPGIAHLLTWKIACQGGLLSALRNSSLSADLEAALRNQFGHRSPVCWTVAIETDRPPQLPSAWLEEDTIRGDFLRAVEHYLSPNEDSNDDPETHLSSVPFPTLAELTAELTCPLSIAHLLCENRPEAVRQALEEAAWLGAELLNPQEARL